MSNSYTQNTILKFLEKAVPQMQTSDDAESCLMKMARENNLTPSAFERTCHMFNSLKLNDLYNRSEMSKRGSYTSTIDVPELVNRYTDYTKDADFTNGDKINGSSCSFLDQLSSINGIVFEGDESEVSFKSAAAAEGDLSVGDIKDLCALHDFDHEQEVLKDALTDKVNYIPLEKKAYNKEMIRKDAIQRERELYGQIQTRESENANKIVKKFASILSRSFDKPDFKTIEADAIATSASPETVKQACDVLVKALKSHNYAAFKYASENRAVNEDEIFEPRAIGSENKEFIDDIFDFHDALQRIDFCKTKIASSESHTMKSVLDAKGDPEEKDTPKEPKPYGKQKKDKTSEEFPKKDKKDDSFELGVTQDILKGVGEGVRHGGKGYIGGYSSLLEKYKESASAAQAVPSAYNKKQESIDNEIFKVEAEGTLNELLYTDNVLSRLEGEDLSRLLEVYKSVVSQDPELAIDKGALRSVLRQAVSLEGGIDLGMLETAAKLRETGKKSLEKDIQTKNLIYR